ncbi:hypothetical protein HMPREF3214_00058 [Alloscardovia omnicolens]|nr:hypothetical protein HMPREF3214_00058 [Alloscardovia omnicolens]
MLTRVQPPTSRCTIEFSAQRNQHLSLASKKAFTCLFMWKLFISRALRGIPSFFS